MARMRVRGWATIVVAVVAIGLLAPAAGVSAAKPHRPQAVTQRTVKPQRIEAGLAAKARERGSVRVIVNFRKGFTASAVASPSSRREYKSGVRTMSNRIAGITTSTGGQVVRRFTYLPSMAVYATPRTLAALKASPYVKSVAADTLSKPTLNESVPIVQGDTMAAAGWGGTNQIVAVLDTGVQRDHPFLAGKTVDEACFATGYASPQPPPGPVGDCPNGAQTQVGTGAAAPCAYSPTSCLHGTHVAGIAVGKRLTTAGPGGVPIQGVARYASLLPIQVFSNVNSSPGAWTSDQAAGLEWLYTQRNAYGTKRIAAANLSIGSTAVTGTNCDAEPSYAPVKAAAELLRTAGIATIYAAGNAGKLGAMSYPACLSAVISVASSTKTNTISDFSNISSFTSIIAPGTDIYSSVPGGIYSVLQGTSMAAPHVAGAWAELKSRFPKASVNVVLQALQATGLSIKDERYPGYTFTRITKKRIKILSAGNWLGATVTALKRSVTSVKSGQTVTLTVTETSARVVGQKPTGKVQFKVGGTLKSTKTIDPVTGKATYVATISGPKGKQVTVQAFYLGAGPFVKSQSTALKVTIK